MDGHANLNYVAKMTVRILLRLRSHSLSSSALPLSSIYIGTRVTDGILSRSCSLQWMVCCSIPLSGLVSLMVQAIYVKRLVNLSGDKTWMKLGLGILVSTAFMMSPS
jgi:hypothetical protein